MSWRYRTFVLQLIELVALFLKEFDIVNQSYLFAAVNGDTTYWIICVVPAIDGLHCVSVNNIEVLNFQYWFAVDLVNYPLFQLRYALFWHKITTF